MNRMSFRVIEGGRSLHRVPCVPEEPSPARGVCVGLVLSVPVWWAIYGVVQWARALRP